VSETTGSEALKPLSAEAATLDVSPLAAPVGEVPPLPQATVQPAEPDGSASLADAQNDSALEVDVEEIAGPVSSGFQAFLQHANLHNLLQIESLSRTTGVFLVVSQNRRGYLHLANGELVHAETGSLTGELAAAEILAWGDGEFKSCTRPLVPARTIHSSLQLLLLRLAKAADEANAPERQRPPERPSRRIVEDDAPTDPQAVAVPLVAGSAAPLPVPESASAAKPPSLPPRSSRLPPPLPPRIDRESTSVTEVTLSATGEISAGRGAGVEEFSARVAYAARLAELIGRAIRSGTPRALELRGKTTQTLVRWQADGNLTAAIELVQPVKR
jgi:Domain of unknown function (DUF4388)